MLRNIDLLSELPFYEELSIIKTNNAFRGYTISFKVQIIEKKDPINQLEVSKSSIKDLFRDLLNETKHLRYQITLNILSKKYKPNGEIEFRPVYFNSTTNHRFRLENSFQEILYQTDDWINEGSGWIVESIESQYINISTYRPLSGSSYMDLPVELKSPRKGLINIKNKYQKCFLWCHVRHINPSKEHPERIKKTDKKIAEKLDYDGIEFPVQEKDFSKIEVKNNICINVFGYENELVFPIYVSDQKFEDSMDLLLLTDDDKSHYVYIKNFDRFMFHKTKNKNKKRFCRSCLQCFSSKNVLAEHKKNCLIINGKQSVKLKKRTIKFKDYSKQIPVPIKIYADFDCNLQGVESCKGSYIKNIKITFFVVLLLKFALMIDLVNQLLFLEVKMLLMNLFKQFLKSISTEKK